MLWVRRRRLRLSTPRRGRCGYTEDSGYDLGSKGDDDYSEFPLSLKKHAECACDAKMLFWRTELSDLPCISFPKFIKSI